MSIARGRDRGRSLLDLILVPKPEIPLLQLAIGQGPAQAPLEFIFSSVLRGNLIHLLELVDGVPFDGSHSTNQTSTRARPQPVVVVLRVGVPLVLVVA